AYDKVEVARDLSVTIPDGKITCIIGANGCGKSTLLRSLARLLKPTAGTVLLDGKSIHTTPTSVVATRLGLLPQSPTAPEGITVADLVARGRYPHQKWFRQWSDEDERVVTDALRVTGTLSLARRAVDELSGGQRQRVWIAMTLAQGTPLMLMDEPTTYLDLAHQVEVLDLMVDLNRNENRTIVLVLHDLNQAVRYSDHLIVLRQGKVVATGAPSDVISEDLVDHVFGLRNRIVTDEVTGKAMVIPIGRYDLDRPAEATTVGLGG
ncbi:MAG: Iron-chelate-transporting ATPase, partial [Microbacterium sp.]|uniref:ABC transporter ATP-binding protein n=1 Tax=Microbacterium sp. TaxID=51671 RepID=UPI00260C2EB1